MEVGGIATNIEEAGPKIAERTAADGDDWRVKIMRRMSPAAPQETVAIFDGATSEQLLSPEPWLAKFAGGSQHYSFRVVHAKDRGSDRPTAIYQLPAISGTPLSPNAKIVNGPGWSGPSTLVFPTEDAPPKNGAIKWPGAPEQTGAPRQPSLGDGSAGPSATSAMLAQLQQERERLAEDRHRLEMEAVRREAEADRKRMESKIVDIMQEMKSARERPPEPKVDPMETLTKVVTIVTAALTPILPHLVGVRESAAKREDDRLRREREDRAETLKLFQAMNEKASSASQDTMKVITPMVDAVSQMGRTVLQQIAMMRDMAEPPPQDDGLMGVLKTAIAAWAEAAARGPMIPPTALPSQPRPVTSPPQPRPAPAPQSVTEAMGGAPDDGDPNVPEMTPTQMMDLLGDAVRAHSAEADLASDIVDALGADDFVRAIMAEGGIMAALQKRLGDAWANDKDNVAYIQRLLTLVAQIAAQRGIDVRPLFAPQT
jgi:hypothetical protein